MLKTSSSSNLLAKASHRPSSLPLKVATSRFSSLTRMLVSVTVASAVTPTVRVALSDERLHLVATATELAWRRMRASMTNFPPSMIFLLPQVPKTVPVSGDEDVVV